MAHLGVAGIIPLNIFDTPPAFSLSGSGPTRGQNFYDLNTLYHLFQQDKVDLDKCYLSDWQGADSWHEMVDSFFKQILFKLKMPEGWIVEIGTHKAISFNKLCSEYGQNRCLGFDICPYVYHPAVVVKDIRSIGSEYDRPVAFGWNNASNWEGSPRSKVAALQFLTRNIVNGGFLLDDSLPDMPHDVILPEFKTVWSNQTLVLLQKVS